MSATIQDQIAYWDKGVRNVPDMTGAKAVMDCADLREVARVIGFALPLTGAVLDVGCGTGRAAQICAGAYVGTDVAPSMVDYCRKAGLTAYQVTLPAALATYGCFDAVLCVSVFTHIPRSLRQDYLAAFSAIAPRVLVDILPSETGVDHGDIAAWYADPDEFLRDVAAVGFDVAGTHDLSWEGIYTHRYHWLRSARPLCAAHMDGTR